MSALSTPAFKSVFSISEFKSYTADHTACSRRGDEVRRQFRHAASRRSSDPRHLILQNGLLEKNLQQDTSLLLFFFEFSHLLSFSCAVVHARTMDETYRQRKIDHVTGLTGGSVWEINTVTFVAPVCYDDPGSFIVRKCTISLQTGGGTVMGSPPNSSEVL